MIYFKLNFTTYSNLTKIIKEIFTFTKKNLKLPKKDQILFNFD